MAEQSTSFEDAPPEESAPAGQPLEARPGQNQSPMEEQQGRHRPSHPRPTRTSASWTGVVIAVVVLALLVVFIAQNTQRTTVHFLGFNGHAPTAVALLIAAVAGAVIVVIFGVSRIIQLRKTSRAARARGEAVA